MWHTGKVSQRPDIVSVPHAGNSAAAAAAAAAASGRGRHLLDWGWGHRNNYHGHGGYSGWGGWHGGRHGGDYDGQRTATMSTASQHDFLHQ